MVQMCLWSCGRLQLLQLIRRCRHLWRLELLQFSAPGLLQLLHVPFHRTRLFLHQHHKDTQLGFQRLPRGILQHKQQVLLQKLQGLHHAQLADYHPMLLQGEGMHLCCLLTALPQCHLLPPTSIWCRQLRRLLRRLLLRLLHTFKDRCLLLHCLLLLQRGLLLQLLLHLCALLLHL